MMDLAKDALSQTLDGKLQKKLQETVNTPSLAGRGGWLAAGLICRIGGGGGNIIGAVT